MDPTLGQQLETRPKALRKSSWSRRVLSAGTASLLLGLAVLLTLAQINRPAAGWLQENAADAEKVVLLNTGATLRGRVESGPDRWTVHTGRGSLVRLELHQIDLVGDDMLHLLVQLRARTRRDQITERVKIARFCIQNELFEEARNELAWLEQDGIDANNLKRLQDQLVANEKLVQSRVAREASRGSGRNVSTSAPNTTVASRPETPSANPPTPPANPASEANPEAAEEDLTDARDIAAIDAEAFSVFVRRIQPPLLLGCAAARCHGPNGAEGFHLERLELGATPTKRMSEANYREVRRWAIEATAGEGLVEWAMKPHGGNRERTWREDESKTNELRAWLEWIKRLEFERLAAVESQVPGVAPAASGVRQASYDPSRPTSNTNAPAANPVAPTSQNDPYDPRVFNQFLELRERLRSGGSVTEIPQLAPTVPAIDPAAPQMPAAGSLELPPRELQAPGRNDLPTNPPSSMNR